MARTVRRAGGVADGAELPGLSAAAAKAVAVGRVRRFPQTKPCRLYRLYARGTVEDELYAVWGWI